MEEQNKTISITINQLYALLGAKHNFMAVAEAKEKMSSILSLGYSHEDFFASENLLNAFQDTT